MKQKRGVIDGSTKDSLKNREISVLYVDDEERNLRVLELLLKKKFNITTAGSGAEALEIMKKQIVHVLLTDEKMAGMTGTELIRRAHAIYPQMIKMLLTGDENQAQVRDAMEEDFVFACITKPFDKNSLSNLFIEGYEKLKADGRFKLTT